MTKMTIVDVINIVYPNQISLGNVTLGCADGVNIFITSWNVPNESEPTVQSLLDMIPSLQHQFDLDYFKSVGNVQLMQYLNVVANEREYDTAISCTSYSSSTILQWKSEADVFISWRDSVFAYTIEQIALMESGQRSIPTFEEFKTELPVIVWP